MEVTNLVFENAIVFTKNDHMCAGFVSVLQIATLFSAILSAQRRCQLRIRQGWLNGTQNSGENEYFQGLHVTESYGLHAMRGPSRVLKCVSV